MSDINDIRVQNEFKTISFSGYKKAAVRKELVHNILDGKIENSCYWSAELLCAGHFVEVWECIILTMSRHIHLANIKLPAYIEMRFKDFKTIVESGYADDQLKMRNSKKLRLLFIELIAVLCLSTKKNTTERVRVEKSDFDMTNMMTKLSASNVEYGKAVFRLGDPKELFISVNEFAFHISRESKNIQQACYWLEWIIQFELICRGKKENCPITRRTFAPVQERFQMDVVWIVWECLLAEATKRDALVGKTITALLNIYSIRFTGGVKRKRMPTLYFAISLLTEPFNINQELVSNKGKITTIKSKADIIYKEIKKNEKNPRVAHIVGQSKPSSLERSIAKLEKMNELHNIL
jgi:hypothetical protein